MMADDHVLDQRAELRRKFGESAQLVANQAQADDHVPQKLALGGITEAAVIAQLVNLAEIVEHGAGEQQVQVHAVMFTCEPAKPAEREYVLEQPAQPGVMNLLGC